MTGGDDVDVPVDFGERAAFLPEADALALADLHLGRAAASNVDAPIDDGGDALSRLETLLGRFDPATVVVAGDLLHSFSHVPRGVAETVAALESTVGDAGADLIVTPGNHDSMLESALNAETADDWTADDQTVADTRRDGGTAADSRLGDDETADEYRIGDGETVVLHGHEAPTLDAERYVIGHDHPALSVDGRKVPCFLYGPGVYEDADVLALPAFTRMAPGSTVNGMRSRDFASPLVTDADAFHPAVYDSESGETLRFPPLGTCRHLL